MALTPDQAKELKDMLKEIELLSIKLKANINTTNLQDIEANADTIKRLFKDLKEEWNELTSDVSIAANSFREVVKEISRQNVGLNDSIKAYKNLTSIADKIQAYQKGYSDLSFKNIAKLKEQSKLEKQRIENAQNLLKEKKLEYENSLSINKDSIKAKQDEIALISAKAGKTKQDYYDLQKLRNEVKNLGKDYIKINTELDRTTDALTQNTALLNDQDEAFKNLNLNIKKIALESINDLDKSFKDIINDVSTTDQIIKNMSKTFENLSGISQKLQEYQENITDVSKEDVEELVKKVKLEQQRLTSSLQLLDLEKQRLEASSTANKDALQRAEAEISILQSKSNLTDDEKASLADLETKKNSLLEIEEDITDKLEVNNKLIEKTKEYVEGNNEEYQKLLGTLDEVEKGVKNINKSFGLNIGKNLKGALGKAGLGNLADMLGIDGATKKMKQLTAQYTNNGKQALTLGQQFKVAGGGLASMGGNLLKGFNPVLLALTGIVKIVQFFIEAMFEADQQVTDIAKSFVISKDAAREVREEAFKISDSAKIYAGLLDNQVLTQKEIVAANLKINELLGVSVNLISSSGEKGKFLVAQFAAISKFLKLSEEEQKGLLDLQATSGEEVNDIRNTVLGTTSLYKIQTGILLNERKVLENVLKASNAIKLSTKGGLEGLTKSAIEAAKLGLSLQKVSDIAGGLLDFEAQITSELEAELITGKDLNLELAQQAALQNDLATVASEISKNIGSAANYSKMNRLEQEALAKAVGMTREELADVLTTQENLNKLKGKFTSLGDKELELIKKSGRLTDTQIENLKIGKGTVVEYYKALEDAGVAQEDIIKLLGEQAAASLSSQTAQEKFNETLEKAKETFSRFVDGGYLDKLADALMDFVNSSVFAGAREEAAAKTSEEIRKKEDLSKLNPETVKNFEEAEKAASDQIDFFDATMLNISAGLARLMGNEAMAAAIEMSKIGKEAQGKTASEALQKAKTEGVEQTFGAKPERKSNLTITENPDGSLNIEYGEPSPPPTQGQDLVVQMQDGLIKKNKGLKENGGLVISKFQEGHLQPIAQGISRDQAFALTTNDAKPAPSPSSISNDIASGVVTLIDKISTSLSTPSTPPQPQTIILPENNIRPTGTSITQPSTAGSNVTVDNSQVVAAVNKLTEALMSNNNKEITITMNGEVVGKTLVNIMTPGVIRETNLISQPA
jgi:hypothetical protein